MHGTIVEALRECVTLGHQLGFVKRQRLMLECWNQSGLVVPQHRGFHIVLPQQLDDGEWQMSSQVLELTLQTDHFNLRLLDPESGNFLLMPDEEAAAHRAAKARALAEAEARRVAEAEIERLRALLEQQSKG